MRRKRGLALLCLLLLTASALAGCWDKAELEELAWVLAVGVDQGKESQYAVTAMIALPDKLAGGKDGGGGGKPYLLTTVEAPTVAGAMAMIDGFLSRRTSLQHLKVLFMGEDLAKISGMHTMDEFVRFRQTRRAVMYVVTRGEAAKFLSAMETKIEKNPQRFFEQITNNYRATGLTPGAGQIQSFVTTVNTGYMSPITYYAAIKEEGEEKEGKESSSTKAESGFASGELPRKGGPNVELVGAAAFKGERMVGVLTGDEMRMVLLLQDQFRQGYFSVPDPIRENLFISLLLRRGRPLRVTVDLTSGATPRINALATLEGELVSIQSNKDYTEPDLQARLEAEVAGNLEKHIRDLVEKTQKWEADVAGFGEHVVRRFPTVDSWERYDWPGKYKNAEIKVSVRVTLRRFGVQLSPPEARNE